MKVLYVVWQALLGGHVLSTFTISRKMKDLGVFPVLAGAPGQLVPSIKDVMPFEKVQIPIYHQGRETYFTWDSFQAIARLREIIRQHEIDLVHAFDARSYTHVYSAALLENVPVVCTLCGGVDPYYNIPHTEHLIVFSEEQKQKMLRQYRWKSERVHVLPTRLDFREILSDDNRLQEKEMEAFRLLPKASKIMMISSFDSSKFRSIFNVLNVAEQTLKQGRDVQFVMIGGRGEYHEKAQEKASQLCEIYGEDRVILTGPVPKAFRLLQEAQIVLGVGRSAFEGMAYGKPTLIVGEKGFAGAVSAEMIEELAYFNFSGRNIKAVAPPETLAIQIESLLSDEALCREIGAFGEKFVFDRVDVEKGGQHILEIYRQAVQEGLMSGKGWRWLSLISCLIPIVFDNFKHGVKKKLLTVVNVGLARLRQ